MRALLSPRPHPAVAGQLLYSPLLSPAPAASSLAQRSQVRSILRPCSALLDSAQFRCLLPFSRSRISFTLFIIPPSVRAVSVRLPAVAALQQCCGTSVPSLHMGAWWFGFGLGLVLDLVWMQVECCICYCGGAGGEGW